MPSTYSPLLRVELMQTGEKSATWGDITNTNLGTLLEKSIAGAATVDVSAGDVTLSALNGADDEARCFIILITSSFGISRNVIAPATSKSYVVFNGSSAPVFFKSASTSGVELAAGERAFLAWDGADFRRVSVPAASPSFTGTTTIEQLVVTGATTLGDAPGDALTVNGNTVTWSGNPTHSGTHTYTGRVVLPAGSAATPPVTFTGNLTSGIFSGGANVLNFVTGGAIRMSLKASEGVHVGDSTLDATSTAVGVYNRPRLTSSGVSQYGVFENTRMSSSCTSTGHGVYSSPRFEDGVYNTTNAFMFRAADPTPGAGHTILNSVGFYVDDLVAGSTTNRGMRLTLSAGSTRHNVYADGSAQNYFRGNVGIGAGKTTPTAALEVDGNIVADNGVLAVTTTTAGAGATVTSMQDGSTGVRLVLFQDSASPAANDLVGEVRFNGRDSGGNATVYGQIYTRLTSPTNGSEEGALEFYTNNGGALSLALELRDGVALLSDNASVDPFEAGYRGSPVVTRNSTTAFGLSDAGKTIIKTNTTAYTWTISPDATTDFPDGATILLQHDSTAGDITIARGAGVALINGTTDANETITAGNGASIQKLSANRWRFRG